MRKMMIATGLAAMTLTLSACGSSGVFNRDRPDEFAVSRQAPLIIPPDFALVPPAPGAAPAANADTTRQVMEAMFGTAPRSASEAAAIDAAGGRTAEPGIRSSVGDPNTNVVDKGMTTRDIIAAPEGDGQAGRASIPQ